MFVMVAGIFGGVASVSRVNASALPHPVRFDPRARPGCLRQKRPVTTLSNAFSIRRSTEQHGVLRSNGALNRDAAQPLALLALPMYPRVMDPNQIVHSDPEILGGTPVFVGTRVPVDALIDFLEGGETIEYFLENYPGVSREQVFAFLEEASRALLAKIA
jgi:uncharacterized protein (DUF433 family)